MFAFDNMGVLLVQVHHILFPAYYILRALEEVRAWLR
jgi:hypothetical protein